MGGRPFSKTALVTVVAAAFALAIAACGGGEAETAATEPAATTGEPVELVYWFWGEFDAPGANAWLAEAVKAYEAEHPNITIKVEEQATDTLLASFQAAATAKSGPDIATLWATGPVLGQVWTGALAPVSDYVPAEELAHWKNAWENAYQDKIWGMPIYLIGVPFAYNKSLLEQGGLDPSSLPATWAEFLDVCKTLRAAGITPFMYGAKPAVNWTTQLMLQDLDSLEELRQAVVGGASFEDPKFTSDAAWQQAFEAGCFNDDVASIPIDQAIANFGAGLAAMTAGTDGMVLQWQKDLGADNVAVSKWPVNGSGAFKDAYNATQSTTAVITAWSEHKQEAADFLAFLHSPEMLQLWFEGTGVIPADDRFDASVITDPVHKELYTLATTGPQVWLPNFVPAQVDTQGDLPAAEAIFTGGSAEQAKQIRERSAEQWRTQSPDELEDWLTWTPASPE